jgi:hypothetical protein
MPARTPSCMQKTTSIKASMTGSSSNRFVERRIYQLRGKKMKGFYEKDFPI